MGVLYKLEDVQYISCMYHVWEVLWRVLFSDIYVCNMCYNCNNLH